MAAVNVTGNTDNDNTDNNYIGNGARVVVRNSAGTPYVVVENITDSSIDVWKGNSTTPSGTAPFAEQDAAGASHPDSGGVYGSVSAAIDSSDIIHIVYMEDDGNTSACRYVTFNTSTDTFSGDTDIIADIGADPGGLTILQTSIAIDSNDIPHVAYTEYIANMGSDWNTVVYNNRIGGAWNSSSTLIEGGGSATNKNCSYPSITIDSDNKPQIAYNDVTGADVRGAIGDANDASSFTLQSIHAGTTANPSENPSIGIDSNGDTWVAFEQASGNNISLRQHIKANAWTSWEVTLNTLETGIFPALVIDGTDAYIFYEDPDNDDIVYNKYTGSWLGETSLETGTYNTVKA